MLAIVWIKAGASVFSSSGVSEDVNRMFIVRAFAILRSGTRSQLLCPRHRPFRGRLSCVSTTLVGRSADIATMVSLCSMLRVYLRNAEQLSIN